MSVSFFGSVKSFSEAMAKWVKSGMKLVEKNEADRRASICAGCHNNKPSTELKGCSGCKAAILFPFRKAIIGSRSTMHEQKLTTCQICGCDLKIKVWMPFESLGYDEHDHNAYPSFCWLKEMESK